LLANPNAILGRTVRDRITGFAGVAIGHVVYITGCNQTLLAPKVSGESTYAEPHWFDDQRLDVQPGEPLTLPVAADWSSANGPGCDKAAPKI
jgi:hypothetical protein